MEAEERVRYQLSLPSLKPSTQLSLPLENELDGVQEVEIHSSFTPLGARPSCILTFASCLTCLSPCLLSADCSPASVYPSVSSVWRVSHTLTMLIFYLCIFFLQFLNGFAKTPKINLFQDNAVRYACRAVPAYSLAHKAIILHNCITIWERLGVISIFLHALNVLVSLTCVVRDVRCSSVSVSQKN